MLINIKTLKDYLSVSLKIPRDCIEITDSDWEKFISPNKTIPKFLQESGFSDVDVKQGIGKAAIGNATISQTKERIENYCGIPKECIVFLKKNGDFYHELTHIDTVRRDWGEP